MTYGFELLGLYESTPKRRSEMSAIQYIEDVCKLEQKRFLGTNFDGPFIGIAGVLPEIKRELAKLDMVVDVLERIARLGNGDQYGNSEGNIIAIELLKKLKEN
jgi:hypothetical protein